MKKQLSTSALSKKMGISKYKLDEILIAAKYIVKSEDGYKLTDLGIKNGGVIKKL